MSFYTWEYTHSRCTVQYIKYNHACIWTFDTSGTSVIQHKENNHY